MKKKIIRNTVAIVSAAVILTFLAVTFLMYTYSVELLKIGTENEAETLKAAIDAEGINFLKNETLPQNSRRITIVNQEGEVLYDSVVGDAESMDNHKKRPEIAQALKQSTGASLRDSDTMDKKVYYYAVMLTDGNVLRVSSSMDSIYQLMFSMAPFMLLLVAAIIGISIAIIYIETGRMVRPINEINLDRPLEEPIYEEFMPLLTRMDHQNERIRIQLEELKRAEGIRREFSANVSHELKTPISAILMSLKLLEDKRIGDMNDEQIALAGSIRESSDRLLEITGELLKMTQVEAGKLQLNPKITKPIELIDYAIKANRVQAERFNCHIEVEYPEKISKLFVDSEKIAWVLTNLLSNAIHYTPENGRIVIGAHQVDKKVEIFVQDFGKGIDPRYHQSIFDRYFRVPGTKVQGSGLGLAISKDFVEAHGGTIRVDSEVGKGSTFVITFDV